MSDIILSEEEFAAIRSVIAEARAARDHFRWLSGTARRIIREDIAQPLLSAALDKVDEIDLENPRVLEAADAPADKPGTSRSKKRNS
jgi:hypothetical protein